MRSRLLAALAIVAVAGIALVCAGCNRTTSPTADEGRSTEGVFALTVAAGEPVPSATVRGGAITLYPNQTFLDVLEFLYVGEWMADTLRGDYMIRGDTISFYVSTYGTYRAAYEDEGRQIRFGAGPIRWEYRRR